MYLNGECVWIKYNSEQAMRRERRQGRSRDEKG